MIEYKIVETELGRIVLGAVDGKLAFCHFAVPSLEAVLERVAADFPGEVIVPFGEQKGTMVCPDAGNVAVGEHMGALVCPNGERIAIGEHRSAELYPEGVSHCLKRDFSLDDLLSGRGSIFKWEDMYVAGTPLQVAVWREMYSLDRRELITYSQLAARCGRPRAVRAIASAVGKNPFSLIIPCHRVLKNEAFGADGKVNASKLGNYHWGKDLKRRILLKEGLL